MIKKILSFFVLLLPFYCSAQVEQQQPIKIPFTLTEYNNIAVAAVFNQRDSATLMFHVAVDGVSTIIASEKKLSSIEWSTADTAQSWGGKSISKKSVNNSLQIGSLKWDSLRVTQSLHSGLKTDGKFGPNIFNASYYEINFDSNQIIIHSQLPTYAPNFQSTELLQKGGYYFINGAIHLAEESIINSFMLHSGYSSALLLDDDFANQNSLSEKLSMLSESKLLDSFGNVLKTKKTKVEGFTLGTATLKNVPTSFFEGAIRNQKYSVVGMDVLKRYNLIFDLRTNRLYFQENTKFNTGFVDEL